jgi:hypothetical protein
VPVYLRIYRCKSVSVAPGDFRAFSRPDRSCRDRYEGIASAIRRAKFVDKLEEQKLLLQDPTYIRTVQRMVEVDGHKQPVIRKQRVRPWWKTDPSGQLVMSIKFGAKAIEFEKGNAGIAVPSKEKLPEVIDTLISAIRAGEFDEHFAQASWQRQMPTGRPGTGMKTARPSSPKGVRMSVLSGCPYWGLKNIPSNSEVVATT